MLQFARLPPHALWIQAWVTPHDRRGVAPFGYLRVQGSLHLAGAVSLLATPFIGSQRQGIHHVPLVTCVPTMQIGEYRRNHFAVTTRRRAEGKEDHRPRPRRHAVAMQLSRYTPPPRLSGRSGLEARTCNVQSTRSVPAPNLGRVDRQGCLSCALRQLLVETTGLEPVTFSVQGRRSPS
jgi:hypothetical protein